MDILIDTNIIISGAIFPNVRMGRFLSLVSDRNNLFLCSYAIDEATRVVAQKFPAKKKLLKTFLEKLPHTFVSTPKTNTPGIAISIRDPKDYPILASAIDADVDILITGDKDFEPLNMQRPEILTISQFMEKYGNGAL